MRISRLALEAYGHFSDVVIDMRPEADLTVIHGGNEAGKTTALSAIADLLYGIDNKPLYGFMHALPDMSIAATIQAPDGNSLSVRRLKRKNRTLVDFLTNEPLPDDALEIFLRGRSRSAFLDVYGLDRERLRIGGRKLLQGGGDIGESLVSSAPGLSNVLAIRDKLAAAAVGFHNHQRKTPTTALSQAVVSRDEAKQAVRDLEVRAETVKTIRLEAENADRERREAVVAESKARMEVARLDRLQHVAREFAAVDRLKASRSGLGHVPDVTPEDLSSARASLRALADARSHDTTCRSEQDAAKDALDAIVVDLALLAVSAEVESLDERRAVVTAALEDVPKRRDEIVEARGNLARIVKALGLSDVDEVRRALPGDPMLERADRLADRMSAMETARTEATAIARRCAVDRAKIDAEIVRVGSVDDPIEFRRRLDALDGCEERAVSAKKARADAMAEARRLDLAAAALGFGVHDLEGLACLALPTIATATAVSGRVSGAEGELKRAEEAARSRKDDEARAVARVRSIEAAGAVPTAGTVEAARRSRDATWSAIRPVLVGDRDLGDDDAAAAARMDEALSDCDVLADDRWAGSARAADLLQSEKALADAQVLSRSADLHVEDSRSALADLRSSWDAQWSGAAIQPTEPSDLIERLRRAIDALAQRGRLERLRDDETTRVSASDLDGRRLKELGRDLGFDGSRADVTVSDLRRVIADLDARFKERRDAERDLKHNDVAVEESRIRSQAIDAETVAVAAEAEEIFPALSVRPGAASGELKAAIGLWRDAKASLPALLQLEHRVARIDEMRLDFDGDAAALVGRVAPGLGDRPPLLAIRQLRASLDVARQANSRCEDIRLNLEKRRAACERSKDAVDVLVTAIEALLQKFGAPSEEALVAILDRVEEAHVIDGELRRGRPRLDEALNGRPEAEVRAELGESDEIALVGQKVVAESDASAAAADVAGRIERHVLARGALMEIEGRDGAASAAQAEQDAVAAMAAAAEGFVRNHVAARLLGVAVDRYRERHQSPIIARASEAFSKLTSGRWEGIAIDYGEDTPLLKPRRNGKLLDLKALSEGTADQLFLALRVAAIEEHASSSSPLPFVCDDLFTSFDETRTEAGLALLAELGRTTQVVMFTHHEHVVDASRRRLGDKVEVVRL